MMGLLRALAVVAVFGFAPTVASAEGEAIVSGLSQSRVGITINFDGSEILVYGAVDRSAPAPEGPLDVIVTIEGPTGPRVVRKKTRQFGIWMNGEAAEFDRAPEFYAVTGTRPLAEILDPSQDLLHKISLPTTMRALSAPQQVAEPEAFKEALMRLGRRAGAYVTEEHGVSLTRNVLFRADMVLPANLSEGLFLVRVFLLRDGKVIATEASGIAVHKEGIERVLHRLALDQPAIYGVLSLLMAIFAGWGASAAFGWLRR